MKPLTLRIKGMYSYQEEAVIDFERLTEGRLFGIFGPVGSGKSTILEAITFALYGRSERLDKAGQNYNMMNLRSNELLIDYTFALAGEGYRFTVQFKRNSKQFEDVRSPKRVAYQDKNGEWEPLDHTDGAEILGLSYENFTKTIIIPQGKFQDFLHLTPAARTQMLKELFDLDRFDLSKQTGELLNEARSRLTGLEGQLKEIDEVDTTAVREKEEELEARSKAREELEIRLKSLRESAAEMKKVKELEENIAEMEESLETLEEIEPEMKQREGQLERYEEADRAFRELLARAKDLAERKGGTEKALASFVASEAVLEKEIEQAEQQFRATKLAYERREEWKAKAEEMRQMVEIERAEKEIEELNGRLGKGEEVIAERENSVEKIRMEEAKAGEELQKRKELVPDRAELIEVKGWFKERDRLQDGLQKVRAEFQQSEEETAALAAEWEEMVRPLEGKSVEMRLSQQQDRLQQARTLLDSLRLSQRLTHFAEELEPGQPCPLCGATDHPSPYDAGHAEGQLAETEASMAAIELEIQGLRRLETQMAAQARRQHEAKLRAEKRSQAVEEAVRELEKHLQGFHWPKFESADLAQLDRLIEEAKVEAELLRAEGERLEALRVELRTMEADLQRYRDGMVGLGQKKAVAMGRRDTLLSQLSIFSWDNHRDKQPQELKAKGDFFSDEYDRVTREYQQQDRDLEQRKEKRGKLRTEISVEKSRLEDLSRSLAEANDTISARLVEHSFAHVKEVEEMLSLQWNVEEERATIKKHRQDLEKLRTERDSFRKQLAGRKYDQKVHQELETAIEEGEEQGKTLGQTIGELKGQLARMGEQLKKRLALEKEKDALQDREQNLSTLATLFRGSGFVNYVSTMYLQELCRRANDRFRTLTRNRLSLEVREDNTFVVRDMVNDGQIRSVKTLSGGQTFQASLSLALALSDNIQHRFQSRHNLFFLDEGFGTLDRDSLSIVFDTLKELRRENRIVGVISHVEELQQEIDLCLNVRQDEEQGSRVKGSWEA